MKKELSGRPVFCRMTNRSPKDGEPRDPDRLYQLYQNGLSKLQQQHKKGTERQSGKDAIHVWAESSNLQMVAFGAAQLQMLRCEAADDVMNLLLSSERVFVDTLLALDCHNNDPKDDWSTYLILREWNAKVRGDWEFRAFVHNGNLSAISQYNHYCIFPDLLEVNENMLRNEIASFGEALRAPITATSYIIDVAKLVDGTWKVIELNPFAPTTGAALFDWKIDHDVLCAATSSTGDPPVFKIRREVYGGLEQYVEAVMLPSMIIGSSEQTTNPDHRGPWEDFLVCPEDGTRGREAIDCCKVQ